MKLNRISPDLTVSPQISAADVGVALPVSATASPDGSPITLLEVFVDGSLLASVANSEFISTSFTPPAAGNYLLTVRSTDYLLEEMRKGNLGGRR